MCYVFVYGTLKQNEPNHHWMTDKSQGNAELIGKGTTIKKYPLIIFTQYNIPMLLESPGFGEQIIGEVWRVDHNKLKHLDVLEEHPNFYTRKLDHVKVADKVYSCWMYTMHNFKRELLSYEMINEYSTSIITYNPDYLEGKGSLDLLRMVKQEE